MALSARAASAQGPSDLSHNAQTKYGATFYYWRCMYSTGTPPPENIYAPTLQPWDIDNQEWWNTIVRRARNANLGFITVDGWGQNQFPNDPCNGVNEEDPARVGDRSKANLLTAIDSGADDNLLKVALFDDTPSEVFRKNRAKHGVWKLPDFGNQPCNPQDPTQGFLCFDLCDAGGVGEGGWFYFYDLQWKRFFDAVPDQYRLKIDNRPVVFMWHGGYEWYTGWNCFSDMIAGLRAATLAQYSFDPYIIVAESWTGLDSNGGDVGDTWYRWFSYGTGGETNTLTGKTAQSQIGVAIPGYDGSRFMPLGSRGIWDRCLDGSGHPTATGAYSANTCTQQSQTLLDYGLRNNAAFGDLVLIESIDNVEENAHMIDTSDWGSRELTTLLWWTTNHP